MKSDELRRLANACVAANKNRAFGEFLSQQEMKAAIEAYNAPLEPEVPQLVADMATAIHEARKDFFNNTRLHDRDVYIMDARAALKVVADYIDRLTPYSLTARSLREIADQ